MTIFFVNIYLKPCARNTEETTFKIKKHIPLDPHCYALNHPEEFTETKIGFYIPTAHLYEIIRGRKVLFQK